MANLSNINNKFIVTDVGTGQAIVGATNAATGSTLTVGGIVSINSTASTKIQFHSSGNSYFLGGSIGIGATDPIVTAWGNATNTRQLTLVASAYAVINLQGSNAGLTQFSMGVGDEKFYMAYDRVASAHRLVVDSTGNVGIGVTSPNVKLHLSNASTLTPVYQQFTNGTTGVASGDGTVIGIDSDGDFLINNQEAKEFKVYTSDTQRLKIDNAGSIAMGDFSPSGTPAGDYRSFEIGRQGNTITGAPWKSNLYFSTNATITAGSTAFTYRYASVPATKLILEGGEFAFQNAGSGTVGSTISFTERMKIYSDGDVCMGQYTSTVAPTNGILKLKTSGNTNNICYPLLSVMGSTHLAARQYGIGFDPEGYQDRIKMFFGVDGSGLGYSLGSFVWCLNAVANSTIVSPSDEKMRLTKDGYLGIGTTQPDNILHIETSSAGGPQIQLESTSGTAGAAFINFDGGNLQLSTQRDMVSGAWTDTAKSWGGITIDGAAGGSSIKFYTAAASNTSPSERARINKYGQLLINATSSGYGANNYGYNLGIMGVATQSYMSMNYGGGALDTQGVIFGLDSIGGVWLHRENKPLRIYTNNTQRVTVAGDGNVGIGTTTPYSRLESIGCITVGTASNDGNVSSTAVNYSVAGAGSIYLVQGYVGGGSSGDTCVFTYEATVWKSWLLEFAFASTAGMISGKIGGYNNNGAGHSKYFDINSLGCTAVFTNTGPSGQYNTVTFTFTNPGTHPMAKMTYSQGGGDGPPRGNRTKLVWNS